MELTRQRTSVLYQEVDVITKVEELRAAGLWTANRLERLEDPPQDKTYWDYLMMGMLNRGKIMRQEVQWKKMMARKIAFAIVQTHPYLPDLDAWRRDRARKRDQRLEKEKLEAEKHKALNAHMTFLVGEANKLSSMVQEGMAQNNGSKTPSVASNEEDDSDFRGTDSESDDEATIAQEEAAMKQHERVAVEEEVSALNKEADQEMDDLLASLPPEYLASMGIELPLKSAPASDLPADSEGKKEAIKVKGKRRGAKGDKVPTNNAKDNEENVNTERSTPEKPHDEHSGSRKKSDEKPSSIVESVSVEQDLMSEGNGQGMLSNVDYAKLNSKDEIVRQKELDSIAEAAMKLRPKGNTLQTTQVKTAVPFLIKGTLREYQMVGLDWLVTLYENNVNGILADEMGLGKTIQTIALLAHLACVHRIWGPHLIIVPNSVILNWEMEFKKWCPAFKILTYYGSQKERAEKRRCSTTMCNLYACSHQTAKYRFVFWTSTEATTLANLLNFKGWTKPNTFHVCIASYNTVTTDIRSFKRKEWQYMILDEAHNIKNFKSQRWQALLNVRSHSRLLLTGTPLQNSLMELWSLMHFLMPEIFSSHDDFKQWFSNPLTGMVEGSIMYSSHLMGQLHKVLRPFVLRRLKRDVEKELPEKTEHVLKVPLSKRQRYLYDDFMSRRSTRENLKSGNMLSVLNIVMQLRKCCNHPDLFEPRDVVSPMYVEKIRYVPPGLIVDLNEKEFGRDLPVFFDLRKRFTGVSTPTAIAPKLASGGPPAPVEANDGGEQLAQDADQKGGARVGPIAPKLASGGSPAPVQANDGGEQLAQDAERLMPQEGGARVGPIAPKLASGGSPAPVQANDGGEQLAQDAERLMPQEGGARVGPGHQPLFKPMMVVNNWRRMLTGLCHRKAAQGLVRSIRNLRLNRQRSLCEPVLVVNGWLRMLTGSHRKKVAQGLVSSFRNTLLKGLRALYDSYRKKVVQGLVRCEENGYWVVFFQFVPKHASERAPVTVRTDVGGERLVQHAGQFMPQEDDARVLQVSTIA
ncbi:unnamed protein product [Heligmosomoides polygyrus]|uniref:Helicase ATP-binding domain-containing protein n=1 Tax=Heligmosomoides polygyrus TaxID=6339 RepID=A0A183FXD6_HELPZ|nr:unnamed protein product [Heligmosomoides polygyrus]